MPKKKTPAPPKGWDGGSVGGKRPRSTYVVDGYSRTLDEEKKLNEVFTHLFSTDLGEKALRYLRSITIEAVSGPNIEDHVLRHLEGQRFLVGVIQKRINDGKDKLPDA